MTLIGDAAHLMPPSGEGANLALRDGADLAVALADSDDWPAAVAAHEAMRLDRAAEAAVDAARMLAGMFAPDGLEQRLEFFRGHHQSA